MRRAIPPSPCCARGATRKRNGPPGERGEPLQGDTLLCGLRVRPCRGKRPFSEGTSGRSVLTAHNKCSR
jgi:hypothetical protein